MNRNREESRVRERKQFEKSLWLTDGRKSALCKASLAEVLINILIPLLINYSLDSMLQSWLSLPELTARMALLLWAKSALSVSWGNLKQCLNVTHKTDLFDCVTRRILAYRQASLTIKVDNWDLLITANKEWAHWRELFVLKWHLKG